MTVLKTRHDEPGEQKRLGWAGTCMIEEQVAKSSLRSLLGSCIIWGRWGNLVYQMGIDMGMFKMRICTSR
jgi:hypothetical protein